jgi:NADPH:quinone reductase-like Zn-dependent oxidoreductase/acyl carrier protein
VRLQTFVGRSTGAGSRLSISTKAGHGWRTVAECQLHGTSRSNEPPAVSLADVRSRCSQQFSASEAYGLLRQHQLTYGPTLQVIQSVDRGDNELVAHIVVPEHEWPATSPVYPAVLDGCLQTALLLADQGQEFLPVAIEKFQVFGKSANSLWCKVRLVERHDELIFANFDVFDEMGSVVVHAEGLSLVCSSQVLTDAGEEIGGARRRSPADVPQLRAFGTDPGQDSADVPVRLQSLNPGTLEGLQIVPQTPELPGPHEVQIRVAAAGLNFRDVLGALNLYPGDPGPPGCEFAGEVIEIGEHVHRFTRGDQVVGLGMGTFASVVNTDERLLVKRPPGLGALPAAGIPVVYCTAEIALRELAELKPGERVLIHAASGGVGIAAVQMAQQVDAEIYATASRPKWPALKKLGIRHMYDSRGGDFRERILRDTEGHGVDFALNSLTADWIPRTFDVLAPEGRFVEIGKRGIWSKSEVQGYRPDIDYHILALDDLMHSDPASVHRALASVVEQFSAGRLQPIVHQVYDLDRAVDAFRHMRQAKHVGKIILRLPETTTFSSDGSGLGTSSASESGIQTGTVHEVVLDKGGVQFGDTATPSASDSVRTDSVGTHDSKEAASDNLLQRLHCISPHARQSVVKNHVTARLRHYLDLDNDPDPNTGFFELGLDSLMSIELRNRLQADVGSQIVLPTTLLLQLPNLAELSEYLLECLTTDGASPTPPQPTRGQRTDQDSDLEDLSDEQVDDLLNQAVADVLGTGEAG